MPASKSAKSSLSTSPAAHRLRLISPTFEGHPEALRPSGIRPVGNVAWGTHICVFYDSTEDFLDTTVAYFGAGLENNEFCVWAVSGPATKKSAMGALRSAVPHFDAHSTRHQIEILDGREWYLNDERFNLERITRGWSEKLDAALSSGFDGIRISGDAFWTRTRHWKEFCAYEHELDRSLAGRKMIALCTYALRASRAVDILDVARAHQCTLARRNGDWEFLETPELTLAKREIAQLTGALDVLSKPFPGHQFLTPRERMALAQIVRGASSKEVGHVLGISPRTVEFHRTNIMRKLGAKNTVDLVRRVVGRD